MVFEFTPDSLADALVPYLDERPTVTASGGELVVSDPLPLLVAVEQDSVPTLFDVRCFQRADDLPHGVACIAANRVNFSGSAGARVHLIPMDDHLVVLVANGVCGPVVAGEEFALAIQSVIEGIQAFHFEVRRYLPERALGGRIDELSARPADRPTTTDLEQPTERDDAPPSELGGPREVTPLRVVPNSTADASGDGMEIGQAAAGRPTPGYL